MRPKQTILVIDDELTLLKSVKERLELEGFNVLTSTTAEQALATIARFPPDLMVVDLRLPGMSGLDFCREVRASDGPSRTVPILFLTTDRTEISKILGLELGGDDYMTKPFSPAEFVARVKALIRRSLLSDERDGAEEVLASGELAINYPRHEARVSGRLARRRHDAPARRHHRPTVAGRGDNAWRIPRRSRPPRGVRMGGTDERATGATLGRTART